MVKVSELLRKYKRERHKINSEWGTMKNDLHLTSAAFENLLCTQERILCRNEDQNMGEEKKTIEELKAQIEALKKENEKLKETVQWMHDFIWEMVRKLHN